MLCISPTVFFPALPQGSLTTRLVHSRQKPLGTQRWETEDWVNTLSSREYMVGVGWVACPLCSHMNEPEQRLLVNLENACNAKSAEAIVALSTLPAALAEAAAWPAHYQCCYSRKPIVTALWSGMLEAGLQGCGSRNGTAFVTDAEWMHDLCLRWCWRASLISIYVCSMDVVP